MYDRDVELFSRADAAKYEAEMYRLNNHFQSYLDPVAEARALTEQDAYLADTEEGASCGWAPRPPALTVADTETVPF
jgi:hypothetical protein